MEVSSSGAQDLLIILEIPLSSTHDRAEISHPGLGCSGQAKPKFPVAEQSFNGLLSPIGIAGLDQHPRLPLLDNLRYGSDAAGNHGDARRHGLQHWHRQ